MPAAPPPPATATRPMMTSVNTARFEPVLAGCLSFLGCSPGLAASAFFVDDALGAAGAVKSRSSELSFPDPTSDVAATNGLWQWGHMTRLPFGIGFLLLRTAVHDGHRILN